MSLSLRFFFISIILISIVDFVSILSRSRSDDDDITLTSHSLFLSLIILLILSDCIYVILDRIWVLSLEQSFSICDWDLMNYKSRFIEQIIFFNSYSIWHHILIYARYYISFTSIYENVLWEDLSLSLSIITSKFLLRETARILSIAISQTNKSILKYIDYSKLLD